MVLYGSRCAARRSASHNYGSCNIPLCGCAAVWEKLVLFKVPIQGTDGGLCAAFHTLLELLWRGGAWILYHLGIICYLNIVREVQSSMNNKDSLSSLTRKKISCYLANTLSSEFKRRSRSGSQTCTPTPGKSSPRVRLLLFLVLSTTT